MWCGAIYKSLSTHGSGACTVKLLVYYLIGAMTLSITTLSIMGFSKITLSINGLICDTGHNDTQHNGRVLLCCVICVVTSVMYAKCYKLAYQCCVTMLSVVVLSVVVPFKYLVV